MEIACTAKKVGKARATAQRFQQRLAEDKYGARLVDLRCSLVDKREAQRDLKRFYDIRDERIRFQARLEEYEDGEKITPIFFQTMKQNQDDTTILVLQKDNGEKTTSEKEVMGEISDYFRNELKYQSVVEGNPAWWEGIKQISEKRRDILSKPVTRNEITTAVYKDCKPGKSPGNDGLSIAFYRTFWPELNEPLMSSFTQSMSDGYLPQTQSQSVIKLLLKKGKNKLLLNSWRPISLMNCDAKLFSKVLAKRLEAALA
jgi:hypothetical protein